jgi:hypothetical protein
LSDAIVTAAVFNEIAKHATWPEIVRWSREPALLSVFRFGKHRGERFDAVPEDYLRWIVEGQNELRADVKALPGIGWRSEEPARSCTMGVLIKRHWYRFSSQSSQTTGRCYSTPRSPSLAKRWRTVRLRILPNARRDFKSSIKIARLLAVLIE